MDDELGDKGLSGFAWWSLGRMSANSERVTSDAIDTVLNARRSRAKTHPGHVVNENAKLRAENAQLRQDLADYKSNYGSLRAWAEKAGPEIDRLRADLEISRQDHARLREWGNEVEPLLAQLKKQSD